MFDFPAEDLIAAARLILATFALGAVYLDPTQPAHFGRAVFIALALYLAFAVLMLIYARLRRPPREVQLITHAMDVAAVTGLMYLTAGPTSPFFVFFNFILLSATLRWNWRGAVLTAAVLVLLFLGVLAALWDTSLGQAEELNRVVVRTGYLLVAGGMLAYFGAHRERGSTRLAQLVAWPGPEESAERAPSAVALAHAAHIMGARAVIVLWEEEDEPFLKTAHWTKGRVVYGQAQDLWPVLSDLPAEFCGRLAPSELDPKFSKTFQAADCLTAAFELPLCSGRVFLLEPCSAGDDQLMLARLIALRLGVDLEHELVRTRLETAAKISERSKLARDLHDGLLQTLTASTLHLKLAAREAPAELAARLTEIGQGLADEQRVIREFVEENRVPPSRLQVALKAELARRLRRLEQEWGCAVEYSETPAGVSVSAELARHVRHLIAEAVANAARHGGARNLRIHAQAGPAGDLELTISDDGAGFAKMTGEFDDLALAGARHGPRSLQSRVRELGGELMLRTTDNGSTLRIHLHG